MFEVVQYSEVREEERVIGTYETREEAEECYRIMNDPCDDRFFWFIRDTSEKEN